MSCIKKIALTEPLVDTVDAQQIATRVCSFKSIDMSTCTKDDLAFSVPYRFAATRNDFIHAFVVYWDCGFTRGHKEIWFSTSPRSRTTHWRQTVFYLQEHLACTNGEVCISLRAPIPHSGLTSPTPSGRRRQHHHCAESKEPP